MIRFHQDFCHQIIPSDFSDAISIAEKVIRPLGTLHLTLGVMSLDHEGIRRAVQALQDVDTDALITGTALTGPENEEQDLDTL
jgi:hypothetical protein